uniref:Lymphocyte antigen 96 n=1 Tax=Ursus americanus TaxID=9643 RepID=A0A452S1B3_URSAM
MFTFMLFSTLFSSIFTAPGEQHWICNSSDSSVWYSYCDNMKVPISIDPKPCITLKGSRGYLHLSYVPRKFNVFFLCFLDLQESVEMIALRLSGSTEERIINSVHSTFLVKGERNNLSFCLAKVLQFFPFLRFCFLLYVMCFIHPHPPCLAEVIIYITNDLIFK